MAHPATRGRSLTRDEPDQRNREVLPRPPGCCLLVRPPDFPDHDDGLGLTVVPKGRETVDEARANDRVTPDAHAGRLADSGERQLVHGLVGEGAGSAR